jgi:hypothetical protein
MQMASTSVPKNRNSAAIAQSQAHVADVAFNEMTRLWQAKEIIQLAAHASPECVSAHQDEPPMKQALECAAQMIQTSIEALCTLEADIKADAAEVAHG